MSKFRIQVIYRTETTVVFRLYVDGALTNTGTNSNLAMSPEVFEDFKQRLEATLK